MGIIKVAIEIDLTTYYHLRHIKFDLDGGKDFDYRSRVSISAFNNFRYKRHINSKKNLLYNIKWLDEYETTYNVDKDHICYALYNSIPRIEVSNLWEFYKLIGYDYKTKKYVDTEFGL